MIFTYSRWGQFSSKKWVKSFQKQQLSTNELSEYISYSVDGVNRLVKDGVFVDGIHYYKPSKKLLFDKLEIDNWVKGFRSERSKLEVGLLVDEVLKDIDLKR
jgi:hypothetical protein